MSTWIILAVTTCLLDHSWAVRPQDAIQAKAQRVEHEQEAWHNRRFRDGFPKDGNNRGDKVRCDWIGFITPRLLPQGYDYYNTTATPDEKITDGIIISAAEVAAEDMQYPLEAVLNYFTSRDSVMQGRVSPVFRDHLRKFCMANDACWGCNYDSARVIGSCSANTAVCDEFVEDPFMTLPQQWCQLDDWYPNGVQQYNTQGVMPTAENTCKKLGGEQNDFAYVPCAWKGFTVDQNIFEGKENFDMLRYSITSILGEVDRKTEPPSSKKVDRVASVFYYWQGKGYLVPALKPCLKTFCMVNRPGCADFDEAACDRFAEHPDGFHFAGQEPTYCIPNVIDKPHGSAGEKKVEDGHMVEKRDGKEWAKLCSWSGFRSHTHQVRTSTGFANTGYSSLQWSALEMGTPERYVELWMARMQMQGGELPKSLPNLRPCLRTFCEINIMCRNSKGITVPWVTEDGKWAYTSNGESSSYTVWTVESRRVFSEFSGGTMNSGDLSLAEDDWLVATLEKENGDAAGTIRLKLENGKMVSQFKRVGAEDWLAEERADRVEQDCEQFALTPP